MELIECTIIFLAINDDHDSIRHTTDRILQLKLDGDENIMEINEIENADNQSSSVGTTQVVLLLLLLTPTPNRYKMYP